MAIIAYMDALFSKNVEDKEVFFKKNQNIEGVVEGVGCADNKGNDRKSNGNLKNAGKGEGDI